MARGHCACEMADDAEGAVELATLLEPDDDILPTRVALRPGPNEPNAQPAWDDLGSLPEVRFHFVVARQPVIASEPAPPREQHHTPYGFHVPARLVASPS